MSLLRHAKSRDANETGVILVLRAAGYAVVQIDVPCDLLVAKLRRVHCVEVKNPDHHGKRKTKGLTPAQIRFLDLWAGKGCIHIGSSGLDLLAQIRHCERS